MNSEQPLSNTRWDSKIVTGEKQAGISLQEKHELADKRIKLRGLDSHVASEENKYVKSNNETGHGPQLSPNKDMLQVTKAPVTLESNFIEAESSGRSTCQVEVNIASEPLELNVEDCSTKYPPFKESEKKTKNIGKVTLHGESYREHQNECVLSRRIGVDLNGEDVSNSMKPESLSTFKDGTFFKSKAISECGSSASPLEGRDPMKVWKEMKQNGYMSSSYSSIPIPNQRGKKNKNDLQKKRMQIAKKEQISKFAKIAAPSGLLNELNPGIINHVRNRKQVHSIIEALVKSEKHANKNAGSKQENHLTSDAVDVWKRKDLHHGSRQEIEYLSPQTDTPPLFSDVRVSDVDQYLAGRTSLKGCTSLCKDLNEDDALTIKASESSSSVSNDDSSSATSVSSLSVKAASIASQWLELLYQDIKGRLSALQRSKKRVRAVISTELPFLAAKEFSSNKENTPHVAKNPEGSLNNSNADVHQKQWNMLFEQMDVFLSNEEKELESWSEQVQKMLPHSNLGLQHIHDQRNYVVQQIELAENNSSDPKMDISDKELAIKAAAASIYSTCSFIKPEP